MKIVKRCKRIVLGMLLFLAIFYIAYAFRGWFYRDDFIFLRKYHELEWTELFLKSRGRIITRPLYWFSIQHFFSANAVAFYLINGLIIWANSVLFSLVVRKITNNMLPVILLMLIYILPFTTLRSFGWISVTQHTIPHFFVLLFVFFSLKLDERYSLKTTMWLLVVFVMGLASNLLTVVSPAMAIVGVFSKKALPSAKTIKTLLLFLVLASAYVLVYKVYVSHPSKAYSMKFEWVWLYQNLVHISAYVFSHRGIEYFAFLVGLCVLASVVRFQRSVIGLLLMSTVCALPFIFLVFAHDVYYHGLSFPIFAAAVLASLTLLVEIVVSRKYQKQVSVGLVTLVVVVFFVQSLPHYVDYYRFPRGRSHVKLAQAIEQLGLKDTVICAYRDKHLSYVENQKETKLRFMGNYILDYFNRNGNLIVNGTSFPGCSVDKPNVVMLALKRFKNRSYKFQFYKNGQPLSVESQ